MLLVDDILDTGQTLHTVLGKLSDLHPHSLKTCVLLEKTSRRRESVTADYVGFEVPDGVVGYGLDYAERFHHLPFIGVLKPEVYMTVTVQFWSYFKDPTQCATTSLELPEGTTGEAHTAVIDQFPALGDMRHSTLKAGA